MGIRLDAIREMLNLFSQAIAKKKITQELVGAYDHALARYTLEDIRQAGYKCLDDCQYFPKVKDVLSQLRLVDRDKQMDGQRGFELAHSTKCQLCGAGPTQCGRDKPGDPWECRRCYTGMTSEQINAKLAEITATLSAGMGM